MVHGYWNELSRARLLQQVMLLHLLNDQPEQPSRPMDDYRGEIQDLSRQQRHLTYRQERRLAQDFALLAANTDDPRKVTSACVEEGANGRSMEIKLAVNNGGLDEVQDSFRKMAKILQRINSNGSYVTREAESYSC